MFSRRRAEHLSLLQSGSNAVGEANRECLQRAFMATSPRLAVRQFVEVDGNQRLLSATGRELRTVRVDGQDVAGAMTGAGLARSYWGGKKQGWC